MNYAILTASTVLVVLLTLLLAREMRLRRAVQSLLSKLLSFWRNRHAEKPVTPGRDDASIDGGMR